MVVEILEIAMAAIVEIGIMRMGTNPGDGNRNSVNHGDGNRNSGNHGCGNHEGGNRGNGNHKILRVAIIWGGILGSGNHVTPWWSWGSQMW